MKSMRDIKNDIQDKEGRQKVKNTWAIRLRENYETKDILKTALDTKLKDSATDWSSVLILVQMTI